MPGADFTPLFEPPTDAVSQRFIHVVGVSVWVHEAPVDEGWGRHFVGMLGDDALWSVDVPAGEDPTEGAAVDLYGYHGRVSEAEWLAAGRAVQIVEWARTHRFCGRCGTPTEPARAERAMKCPDCGLVAFPRIAPAMITLVTRGDDDEEALLARGVHWQIPMYSCLAGFVEPGETLESAVVREVREEVGIEVSDVRYQSSQPWPFPHSLMLGFRARHAGGEIVCDETEILDAAWFRRDELPMVPGGISIARKLIDAWVAGGG